MKPLNWFYDQLFPSLCSVSTEQQRICVENWPETQNLRGDPERLRISNLWLYRHNFQQLIKFHRLMPKYKETCCVNMSRNSQIFLNNRNWPNFAPMLVSQRILRKENSSLHVMMIHLTNWWDHVESTLCLEVMSHRRWKGGSVETRRSVQSWRWRSVTIKDVTVRRSRSNLHFVIELVLVFVSWMVTETLEEIPVTSLGERSTGQPVAKATPRPTPTLTLSLCVYSVQWAKVDRYRTRNI